MAYGKWANHGTHIDQRHLIKSAQADLRYPSMFFVIKVQCLTNKETNEQMHGTNVSYKRDSNLEANTIATELMRILVKEFQFEFCAYLSSPPVVRMGNAP